MTTNRITTVWQDGRGPRVEVRHTRFIESHTTLCGLGTEHTRNYSKWPSTGADKRCDRCQHQLDLLNAQWAAERAEDRRIDSANFPSDRSW